MADEVTNMEVDKVADMVAEFALMKVAPPSSKISNLCKWRQISN